MTLALSTKAFDNISAHLLVAEYVRERLEQYISIQNKTKQALDNTL